MVLNYKIHIMKILLIKYIVSIMFILFMNNQSSFENPRETNKKSQKDLNIENKSYISKKVTPLQDCNNASFENFWLIFREAIINSDSSVIKQNTIFPLSLRGPLDEDPIINISGSRFIECFNAFLKQPSGLNRYDLTETEMDYIKRTPSIFVKHLSKFEPVCIEEKAMIGGMKFKLCNERWYLSELFLEYETFQNIDISYP